MFYTQRNIGSWTIMLLFVLSNAVVWSQQMPPERKAPASEPDTKNSIRQVSRNLILVPVRVQGLEREFVLDTAAGETYISPATRDALGFTASDGQKWKVPAAGGAVETRALRVSSFALGGYERKPFRVVVLDLAHLEGLVGEPIAGIVGTDFLKNFDLKLDLSAQTLQLYAHHTKYQARSFGLDLPTKIPFTSNNEHFIFFRASLNGTPITCLLDTGASGSVINWRAAQAAGVTTQTQGLESLQNAARGADTNVVSVYRYQFKQIKVGPTDFGAAKLNIADLPVFETLKISNKPVLLFGANLLKNRVLFIAYSTKHI